MRPDDVQQVGEAHIASSLVLCSAETVFAFMQDPTKLKRWSFGTWETEIAQDGLVTGTSIFDGSKILLRIEASRQLLSIDYHLGSDPQKLVPRINVRVIPGLNLGLTQGSCVLTFVAWRTAAMTEDRWRKLKASHEFEVILIKNLLENNQV